MVLLHLAKFMLILILAQPHPIFCVRSVWQNLVWHPKTPSWIIMFGSQVQLQWTSIEGANWHRICAHAHYSVSDAGRVRLNLSPRVSKGLPCLFRAWPTKLGFTHCVLQSLSRITWGKEIQVYLGPAAYVIHKYPNSHCRIFGRLWTELSPFSHLCLETSSGWVRLCLFLTHLQILPLLESASM